MQENLHFFVKVEIFNVEAKYLICSNSLFMKGPYY